MNKLAIFQNLTDSEQQSVLQYAQNLLQEEGSAANIRTDSFCGTSIDIWFWSKVTTCYFMK